MNDALTLIVICVIILFGFWLKQFWISLIFVIILILGLIVTSRKQPAPGPAPRGGGPKVQPIVVKRKYVGPESIYPKKMTIKYTPWTPSDWREYGPEAVGKSVGAGAKWFRNLIFGKK